MAREQDIGRILCETIAVPPGATAAAFFPSTAGFYGMAIKYLSGGSLSLVGASTSLNGFTASAVTGSTYATASAYLMGTSEVVNVNHFVGDFYLQATGSTAVAALIRQYTQGN